MAKRSGSDTRQRTTTLSARFTPEEAAAIRTMAQAAEYTVGDLIRRALFETPPPRTKLAISSEDRALLKMLRIILVEIKGELGKHGSNLNQIAHQLNLLGPDMGLPRVRDLLESALEQVNVFYERDMAEMRLCWLQAMGQERERELSPWFNDDARKPPGG